jgi:hypothetical protein
MAEVNRAAEQLRRYRERRAKVSETGRAPAPNGERMERTLMLSARVAADWWASLQ